MVRIAIFAFVCLVFILFLKNYRPEYALIAAAVAGSMMLIVVIKEIFSPINQLLATLEEYGIKSNLISYLLKALGICFLTKFSSELCADFGQSSLAGKVELAGRAAVFLLSLPLIENILNTGLSLL